MKKMLISCCLLVLSVSMFVGCGFFSDDVKVGTVDEFLAALDDDKYGAIILTDDLDFSGYEWPTIYDLSLEGEGHTIKNVSIERADGDSVGMFPSGEDVSIGMRDVTIENLTVNYYGTGSNIGGLMGRIHDDGTGEIQLSLKNVKITGKVYAPSATNVGGVIGSVHGDLYNYGTQYYAYLTDVESNVEVIGNSYVGGVVGKIGYAKALNSFFDQVMGNSGTEYSKYGAVKFENVTNKGNVTANGSYAGGIAGAAYTLNDRIEDCRNSGTVKAKTHAGGLFGMAILSLCSDLENEGLVKTTSSVSTEDYHYAGGIAGAMYTVNQSKNLKNSGTIESGGNGVGGIAGFIDSTSLLECSNSGKITGAGKCGGIAGLNQNISYLLCKNEGEIVSTGTSVGGISGYCINGFFNMCTNSASVSGSDKVAGIVGECFIGENDEATVAGSTNSGSVTSGGYAAGIIGYSNSSNIKDVDTSSNTGEIMGNTTDEIANIE